MERYQIIEKVGSGNSALVFKARDSQTGSIVAIKQFNPDTPLEQATMKEVQITSRLDHPNIIKILDIIITPEEQLNIVLEYVDENLLELYSSSKYGINQNQIRCILYQIAFALLHMHSRGYIHRDLKPENILIDRKSAFVKLVDFGSAKETALATTDYVCTRWYRAPESLLGLKKCTSAVDIFALGCIALELFTLKPIFPGDNTVDQLNKIFNILGSPTIESWPQGYQETRKKSVSFPEKMKIPLLNFIPTASKEFIHLVERMLCLDSTHRLTAAEVLAHPFFHNMDSLLPEAVYRHSLSQGTHINHHHHYKSTQNNYHSRKSNTGQSKSPIRSRSKTPETKHVTEGSLSRNLVSGGGGYSRGVLSNYNQRHSEESSFTSKTPPKRNSSYLNYRMHEKSRLMESPLDNNRSRNTNLYAQRFKSRQESGIPTHSRGRSITLKYGR